MSRILKPYPDVIDGALVILLPQWFPALRNPTGRPADFRVGRKLPSDIMDKLPVVRLNDIGGNDDGLTDHPQIDIDVFHTSFRTCHDLAKGIQARLLGYPHRAGSVVIDQVSTAMRPHDVPWEDDRLFRFYSSYRISVRR